MMKYYSIDTNHGRFLFKNASESSFEVHHIAHILRRSFRAVDVLSVDVRDERLHSGCKVGDYQTLEQIFVKAIPHGNPVVSDTTEDFRLQPASWDPPPPWWSVVLDDVMAFPVPSDQKAIRKHNRQYSLWHSVFLTHINRYNIDETTSPNDFTGFDREVVSRMINVFDAVNEGKINQSKFIVEMERVCSISRNDYQDSPLGIKLLYSSLNIQEKPFYVSFSPPHVPGGSTCFCTVRLRDVSPQSTVISVAQQSEGVVMLPDRVTIMPGLTKTTFEITTFSQRTPKKCEIVFSDGKVIVSRTLEVL